MPGIAKAERSLGFAGLVLGLVAACPVSVSAEPAARKQPDIVVFLSDDHGQLDSVPYGSAEARTPAMQRLAERGMVFTHAFVASPSCAPSRTAMLTGLMPARNGAEANHTTKTEGIASLPDTLRAIGYQTVAFGKVAHGRKDKDVARHGFDLYAEPHDAEAVREFLTERRDRAKPLCLFVGTHEPHVPWLRIDGYSPAALTLPETFIDTPETRDYRARYLTDVTDADRQLGEVLDLADKHLSANRLFIYTSDHGGQWPFAKWNLYDAGIRVPLIVSWPGVVPPGTRTDAMVQWIDLLPTLIDAAGGPAPEAIDGRSFLHVLRDPGARHRSEIFTTHSGDGRTNVYPIRSVRTPDWKLIWNLHPEFAYTNHIDKSFALDGGRYWLSWFDKAKTDPAAAAIIQRYHRRPQFELYDLRRDPLERQNLADDPAHAETVAGLTRRLEAWMAEQGDQKTVFNQPRLLTDPGVMVPGRNAGIDSPTAKRPPAPPRPNIVVVLSDDMGFSDLGCYGSEIDTPNLDRLARGGLQFTQFYNTARCCPTRASLLTGLYPHQAGMGHMEADRGLPGYRGDLNDRCATIAETLAPAGYASYAAGKWHVTAAINPKSDAEKRNWPLQRGFNRFYGTIIGGGNFFDPATLVRDNRTISAFADPDYPAEDYYYTDAISDHAARFIREHDATKPFFLYVAYTAAHWPMHARDRDIAKYAGRYAAGYEAIRQARYAKMLTEGVVTAAETTLWPLPPKLAENDEWLAWDQRNMEVYAAMVDSMDQGIGRITKAIEDAGQADNTLICYLQDNGACAEPIGRSGVGPARTESPTLPPLVADAISVTVRSKQTRDGYPMREGKGVMAGPADTFIAYGAAWATVSNTPFRKYKHFVHEGGIATPLIVHWPRGITNPGRLERTPGHLIDIMATAVDLAGASYPADKTPLEGRSLAPLFAGGSIDREAIYWEHEGNKAVREGDWKLVAAHSEPWELYDLSKDRSEQNDLSGAEPDRVKRMAAMWEAYAARTNVEPWDKVFPPKKK